MLLRARTTKSRMLEKERSNNWLTLKLITKRMFSKRNKKTKSMLKKKPKQWKKDWRKKNIIKPSLIITKCLLKPWTNHWFKSVITLKITHQWILLDQVLHFKPNSFKSEAQLMRSLEESIETLPPILLVPDLKWIMNWLCSEAQWMKRDLELRPTLPLTWLDLDQNGTLKASFKLLQLLLPKYTKKQWLNSKYNKKL